MIDDAAYDILRQALHILLFSSGFIIAGTAAAGIIVGIVQAATSVHDTASSYAVRLLALCITVFLLFDDTSRMIGTLLESVFASIPGIH